MVDFDPPLQRYEEVWNDWLEKEPDLVRLRNLLLSNGGIEVVPNKEPDLQKMLSNGRIFTPIDIIVEDIRDSKCHTNSRHLYLDRDDVTEIGTGWALSSDGKWRQHSWCMRGDEIVETTSIKREKYFGILLEGESLNEFIKMNI